MTGELRKSAQYLREVSDPTCPEKARLLEEYRTKTEAFSQSVRELQELRGTSPLAEYQRIQRLSDEARIKSEQARLALEEHTGKHHC